MTEVWVVAYSLDGNLAVEVYRHLTDAYLGISSRILDERWAEGPELIQYLRQHRPEIHLLHLSIQGVGTIRLQRLEIIE